MPYKFNPFSGNFDEVKDISGKVDKVTSTDNAVTRYDGKTGDVQNSGVTIDDSDNVIIPGSLTVDNVNLRTILLNNSSTGLLDGGVLSINADTTKFDITAATGMVIDSTTDVTTPTISEVLYAGATAVSVTNIATNEFTHIYITSAGALLQSVVKPTPALRRDNIYIGKLVHTDNVNIEFVSYQPEVYINPSNALVDYWRGLGITVLSGNRISANGANLSIDKSAGDIHQSGANYATSKQKPDIVTIAAQTPITFRYRTQTSIEGSNVTVLDPTNYDLSGTVTAIPGSVNRATNVRVYLFQTGNIRLQYGQQYYNSLSEAVSSLSSEPFVIEPNIEDNGVLLGVISVIKGATDLSNVSEAKFSAASKFGEVSTGTGAFSVTTLQKAYNNSITPEIIVTSTNGALSIQDAATPIGANLFEVQSNGGGTNYLSVDATGVVIAGNLTVDGTTTTVNTATLDVTDANITVNNTGNQATAQSSVAGLTVEMSDATDVRIGYDSTTTSRMKLGDVGSEAEIATISHAQTLTNKTMVVSSNTITTAASGNLAATELNAALAELQSDIDTRAVISDVFSITSSSGTFTAVANETHLVDTSGGVSTITLPAASADRFVRIKDKGNAQSNNITINPASGTIDGAVAILIDSNFASVTLVSDGTNWFIL